MRFPRGSLFLLALLAGCGGKITNDDSLGDAMVFDDDVHTPTVAWARQLDGILPSDLATLPDGDVVVAGFVAMPLPAPFETCVQDRGVVVRLSGDDGTLKWAHCEPTVSASRVRIAADGSIVVYGQYPIAIERLSPDGATSVVTLGPGEDGSHVFALGSDATVYVVGEVGAADPTIPDPMLVFAEDASGAIRWSRTFITTGAKRNYALPLALTINSSGDLLLAIEFDNGPTQIDSLAVPSKGEFIIDFDSSSGVARSVTPVPSAPGSVWNLNTSAGKAILTGTCFGAAHLGTTPLECDGCGAYWGCLAMVDDQTFAPLWGRATMGAEGASSDAVFDGAGHVYVGSYLASAGGISNDEVTGFDVATGDAFSRFDASNNSQILHPSGPNVALTPSGALVVAGRFNGSMTLGASTLSTTALNGASYVAKVVL